MSYFIARFTMLSRWHVGTGESTPGRSDDRQVTEEDLPIIPGTTVKGIARAESVDIDDLLGTDLTPVVFGSMSADGRAALGSARSDEDAQPEDLAPAVSRHNRVDRSTGRVADDDLFDAEIVQGGVFDAVIDPETDDTAEISHLAASLLAIERLGSRRRRGWGRCRVTLHDPPSGDDISERLLEGLGGGAT